MSEVAWNRAFTQGSKAMQDRLRKVHAKNPKFQSWLQKSGHGAGQSVKQASKEVKPSARVKTLQQKSLKAYGATKGRRMGGEDGSGETVRDTVAPLTRDQHSKVQAAQRAAKAAAKPAKPAAAKKPLTKSQRLAAIAAAARKAKAKHDVPTIDVDDDHDDLRDVHQSLHIRRGYNEEMEKVDEIVGVLAAMDKADKARSSNLKVGDNVRSIKMPIPGKVEKIENGKVYFRHESGKLYATHAGNLRKEEVELDEANPVNRAKKKEAVRQVGLDAMRKGEVDPARGHSPQRFGREILKGAAADRAVRKAMEKELTRMGEEVELAEGKMKDIVTDREETARLAAQKKPPFTPDKKKVRRGPGGPMSQAKWLAKQAMIKKMKEMQKEEVEQVSEAEREAGYKMPAHVAAAQKKFDAQSKQKKPVQAGTMAALKKEETKKWTEMSPEEKWKDARAEKDPVKKNAKLGALVMGGGRRSAADPKKFTQKGGQWVRTEEVESVEEGVATAQKVMDRANVVAKTNPDPKKRFAAGGLANKAMMRTINPTGVNTGITRGGGNKAYRKITGKAPPLQLTPKTGVSEEVEQIDEASHFRYGGEVNGKEYEVTIPRHRDLGDYSDAALHRKLSKENPHLDHHEVTAIVHSGGEEESKVDVEHKGKKYTHHVINHQEPQRIYSEALDPVGKEDKDIDNDGDSDKTDVYLATKRKAIGKAIKDRLAKKLGK